MKPDVGYMEVVIYMGEVKQRIKKEESNTLGGKSCFNYWLAYMALWLQIKEIFGSLLQPAKTI